MSVHKDHKEGEACSCVLHSSGVSQTLQELEFERGIWSAAMDGEIERVRKLLDSGVDPHSTDSSGYTALHYASRSGHLDVCNLLLSSGASANSQTPGRVAPLHRAAYCGHTDVVRLLVQHSAEVGLADSDGHTPLHKAAEHGHYDIAQLLVAANPAVTNQRDNKGRLPIDLIKTPNTEWTHLLQNM